MANQSSIEWTEHTWNPTTGCTKISPACKYCYAEKMHKRLSAMGTSGYKQPFTQVTTLPQRLTVPLQRKRPTTYFVDSMSDLFHEQVPFPFIAAVLWVIMVTPQHHYQVLTKRPERMLAFFNWLEENQKGHFCDDGFLSACWMNVMYKQPDEDAHLNDKDAELLEKASNFYYPSRDPNALGNASLTAPTPLPNLWLGVSVENVKEGLPRIALLQQVDAAVRFLSIEPLLEDLGTLDLARIDWVIVGGENASKARPMQKEWVLNVKKQCHTQDTAFFFKQWGSWGEDGVKRSKKTNGRLLDGQPWDEMPVISSRQ